MSIQHASYTRTGRRSHNEDSFLALPEEQIFAVSDGMGGLAAGDEASQAAIAWMRSASQGVNAIGERVAADPSPNMKLALLDALEAIFQKGARAIHDAAQARGQQMGATLTAGVVAGPALFICHVGDTRLYLIRGGRAAPLTQDHSVAALQLRRGRITPEQYHKSKMKSVLYQALGVVPQIRADVLEIGLEDGDTVLICSDGAWDFLPRADIAQMAQTEDLQAFCRQIVDTAYDRGSQDNITAVAFRYAADADVLGPVNWDEVLRHVPLFSHLDASSRRQLAPFLSVRQLAAGEVFVREGEPGEELFVVIDGEIAIERGGVELVRIGPGKHLGEIALVLDSPRTATAKAMRPSRVGVLHRDQVDELIDRSPELGARIMQRMVVDLAKRVVDLSERVAQQGG
ncbi:MAG: cyclic nucleotide-binding domain-containing protein [Alphaproteobacteria bacterium]|nr:cyclic nucleotide-binding domain-containing protein [Alphaproteobacteria bacterium]